MTGLPPLRALHYFYQAALHSSFSVAAARLHVTHSAISHQVRQLESWMGKPLFVRASGRVKLTSHGERLLLSCQKAFNELTATSEGIRNGLRHQLNIACAPSFLAQWLIPRLGGFYQRHPEIDVQFQGIMDVDQLRSEHADVLIMSYEQQPDEDVDATLVTADYIGPLCAPRFANGFKQATDLATLPILHADTRRQAWSEWAALYGAEPQEHSGKHFDNLTLGIQAARNGLGVIMAPRLLVRKELEDGSLIAPLGFVRAARATWMMTKQSRRDDVEIALFRHWLAEELLEQ